MAAHNDAMVECQQVCLSRALRRDERPSAAHFSCRKGVQLQALAAGQVLVRCVYVSVDPYLFQYALLQAANVGPVQSRAVGIVEAACEAPGFPVG
jgi:NADPH-dependent curcumin reductase CurA